MTVIKNIFNVIKNNIGTNVCTLFIIIVVLHISYKIKIPILKKNFINSNHLIFLLVKVKILFLVFRYPVAQPGKQRVYAWGLQEHGALGTTKRLWFTDDEVTYSGAPHRLTFGEYYDVKDIATGYGFTAFAVKSKDHKIVYGSGINADSQLGNTFLPYSVFVLRTCY